MKKLISNLLVISFLLPILTACKESGEISSIDNQTKALTKSSHPEIASLAKSSLTLQKELYKYNKKWPRLRALPQKDEYSKAEELHSINKEIVSENLRKHMESLNKMVLQVTDISAFKYNNPDNLNAIVEAEILLLNSLFSIREIANASAIKFLNIMNKFDKEYFDEIPENQEFKKYLFEEYTKTLAISKIAAQDIEKTLISLKEMREGEILSDKQINYITSLVDERRNKEQKPQKEINEIANETLNDEGKDLLFKSIEDHHKEFETLTFLYDPAQNDHPAVHALVIIANLTWGLPNTLVGLGFVITAAILAPITQGMGAIVRLAGYEPYFMEMRFPRLKVAASKMQIYADVCGLNYIPSKMSAGLFELDFCTSYHFASGHEAGHAKQSALLGPLYFPAAILSYTLNMGHGGFIEHWADAWEVHD
ncbi:MAG TPA: hypothetical protein VKY27_11460 [Bacteriovoracaceae bacterium]|nr:hypothetical protein [Bacteriovoracaceae bacterium]